MKTKDLYPAWRAEEIKGAKRRLGKAEGFFAAVQNKESDYGQALECIRDIHRQALAVYEASPETMDQAGAASVGAPDLLAERNKLKALVAELAAMLENLAQHDSYQTEYDGRMYSICPDCGGQDGEHGKACEFVAARALVAKAKEAS